MVAIATNTFAISMQPYPNQPHPSRGTQLLLKTVSIGPSHMDSPTRLSQAAFLQIFLHLNFPTTISAKIYAIPMPHTLPNHHLNKSPGDKWTQLSVTNFLILKPPQYKWNHHKQDLLITSSKVCHFLLWLQIVKSKHFHLRPACNWEFHRNSTPTHTYTPLPECILYFQWLTEDAHPTSLFPWIKLTSAAKVFFAIKYPLTCN